MYTHCGRGGGVVGWWGFPGVPISRCDCVADASPLRSRSINLQEKWPWVSEAEKGHRLISPPQPQQQADVLQNSPFSSTVVAFSHTQHTHTHAGVCLAAHFVFFISVQKSLIAGKTSRHFKEFKSRKKKTLPLIAKNHQKKCVFYVSLSWDSCLCAGGIF